MFKIPTNQDILEFIAQHVNVEVVTKGLDERMHQRDSRFDAEDEGSGMRPKGRNKFLSELSDFNKIRGRADNLVLAITSQMARLSSDDIETQKQCADHVFKQFRLLECVYNAIRQRPLYTLTEQSAGNLAMAEFFLLPYLKRVSHELNQTYPNNFLFYYLKRYIDFVFISLNNPMAAFISEHKRAFSEISPDSDFLSNYRKDRYKKLSAAIDDYSGEGLNLLQFLGWHIAGNIMHSIIKNVLNREQCDDNFLSIVQCRERYYDNIYKHLLSLSVEETVFSALKADKNVALNFIFNEFMTYVDGFNIVEDFMSKLSTDHINQPLYNLLLEIDAYQSVFCQRIYSGEISSEEDIEHAQNLLKAIRSHYHLGCDAFFFAFYIFIAKYQNGQATKNEALTACERVLFESGFDPFTEIGLHITVGNVNDIDMTYAEHMRCRYVGYFNWSLKHELSRYNFVNPIIEVEQFLLSVIKPLDLKTDSDGREYALVDEKIIKKNAREVKHPCVGVMKFGLKAVITNLAFFEYVFQLGYEYPEGDDEVLDVGIFRYALLTKQQQIKLLELIPDETRRLNDVDIELIPEL